MKSKQKQEIEVSEFAGKLPNPNYKINAESFLGEDHLNHLLVEAQKMVDEGD